MKENLLLAERGVKNNTGHWQDVFIDITVGQACKHGIFVSSPLHDFTIFWDEGWIDTRLYSIRENK